MRSASKRHFSLRNGDEINAAHRDGAAYVRAGPGAGLTEGGDFIDQTIAIWQKRTTRQLTREDGREIIENMTGFFRILQEWDRTERMAKQNARRSRTPRTASSCIASWPSIKA
jgi:hypothetical protein